MRTLVAPALALLIGPASCAAAVVERVFEDGYEPPCYGIANDRPGCVVLPFKQPPVTATLAVSGQAGWDRVDVYVLLDRSGSMMDEITALKASLASTVTAAKCPPFGTGNPAQCLNDLWSGAGTIGYGDSGVDAYRHAVDIQSKPDFTSVPTVEPATSTTQEATWLALSSTLTGLGGSACAVPALPARSSCATSPVGASGTGYPCLRPDAGTLVVLVTDEQPSTGFLCPNWTTLVKPEYLARGTRLASIVGSGALAATSNELRAYAVDTGAIDSQNAGEPLVFGGSGTAATTAFASVLQTLRNGVPMSVRAELVDGPGDAVDVAQFVDRIEVINDDSGGCPNGASVADTDGKPGADTFLGVIPGKTVCFRLFVKENATVEATGQIQFFPATLRLVGDVRMTIATIPLTFTVPAN